MNQLTQEAQDTLTFTLRLHDPKEKQDAKKSTIWVVAEIPRANLTMDEALFIQMYVVPALRQMKQTLQLA